MKLPQRTKEKPAYALSLTGKVNGKYYPVFDLDQLIDCQSCGEPHTYTRDECIEDVEHFQRQEGMHTAHIYKTLGGFQVRLFYDHLFTLKEVRELIIDPRHGAIEKLDPKYKEVVRYYMPSGRAAGKYNVQDIKLVAIVGKTRGLTEEQIAVGNSLAKLFGELTHVKFPKKFLLEGKK